MLVDKIFSRKLYEYKDVYCLMRTAFPRNEQIPMWLLRVLALRKSVNFRAFYEDEQFCGVLYTVENNKYIFVLYLAVNDQIRSKGYGTKILGWLKQNTEKIIVLNAESLNLSAVIKPSIIYIFFTGENANSSTTLPIPLNEVLE